MNRQALLVLAGVAALAACDGFKEAMSAHQDVVARAGGQELSVTRLSELLGSSKIPLQPEVARSLADLWVSYQLLGRAAANGDSLADQKTVDQAMWAAIQQARMQKFYEQVSKTWNVASDDAANAARYNQGELLAVRHILFAAPEQGLSSGARDSIRRNAEKVRAQTTPANFAAMAKQYSMDPGSKDKGGLYAGFPRGTMVPEFEKALLALKPGEISTVVQTQFGYHILYRPRYEEVKGEFGAQMNNRAMQVAESTFTANVEKGGKIEIKPNAAQVTKATVKDLQGGRDDRTVIATSTAGDLTAGRLAQWVAAYPPQAQLPQQIANAPDSLVQSFVKDIVRNELMIKQADSAKVTLDSTDIGAIRNQFRSAITQAWTGLQIEPKSLADSGRTPAERERVAAGRIERYLDQLLAQGPVQFVAVPEPVATALREKYDAKILQAGIDRALERASKIRQVADSTRALTQPPSQVPMPRAMPPQPRQVPPQPAPRPAAPAGQRP